MGVGIVIAYWFDYGMSYVDGPVNWRLPVACQMIVALFVVVLVFGYVFWTPGLLGLLLFHPELSLTKMKLKSSRKPPLAVPQKPPR